MTNIIVLEGIPPPLVSEAPVNGNDVPNKKVEREEEMPTNTSDDGEDDNTDEHDDDDCSSMSSDSTFSICCSNTKSTVSINISLSNDSEDKDEDTDDDNDTFYSSTEYDNESETMEATTKSIMADRCKVERSAKQQNLQESARKVVQRRKKRKSKGRTRQSNLTVVDAVKENVKFEVSNTLPSLVSVAFYCIAHLSLHEMLHTITTEITHFVGDETLVYSTWLFIGVLIVRSSGLLWYFLPSYQMRRVRREYQDRLRNRRVDAKLCQWFRDNPTMKGIVDIFGFYLIYMATSYFWQMFISMFDQRNSYFEYLPSVKYYYENDGDYSSFYNDQTSNNETVFGTNENCNIEESNAVFEAKQLLDNQLKLEDETYLYESLSKVSYYSYYGSEHATLLDVPTALFLYASSTLVSLYVLYNFCSYRFLDNW